jgi:hypothetical protein
VQGPIPKMGESAGTNYLFKPNLFNKNRRMIHLDPNYSTTSAFNDFPNYDTQK